jgi:hypothetical protein
MYMRLPRRPRVLDSVGELNLASGKENAGKKNKEFEMHVCIFLSRIFLSAKLGQKFANRSRPRG